MKVLLINGSPQKNGNTKAALKIMQEVFEQNKVDVEILQLGGINIHGCSGCRTCWKTKNKKCVLNDDLTPIMDKCFQNDVGAIVIGSPTYFANVTTEVKAFIDRVGFVAKANDGILKDKIGAPVVIHRRAGATFAYSAINYFFGINEMPIATSIYWNLGVARKPGDLGRDEEGVQTFQKLTQNIIGLLNKIKI
ncbi:MAG: flavodoxin family protein [Mycoplasmataceae bacterium]|nr:flavodoxin family protein [Mycoplasmataceae bacterium]